MQAAGLHGSELDQDDLPALCTVLDGDRSRWPRRPPRGIRSIVRWQGHICLRHLISVRPLGFDRGLVQLGAALRAKLGGAWTLRAALTARDRHEGSLHALEGCLEYLATLKAVELARGVLGRKPRTITTRVQQTSTTPNSSWTIFQFSPFL